MHLAVIIILHLAFRGHLPISADIGCLRAVCSHSTAISLQAIQVSLSSCCHSVDSPIDSPPILFHPSSWTFSRIHQENAFAQLLLSPHLGVGLV